MAGGLSSVPSRCRRSTVVRASPANPTHVCLPSGCVTGPSRRAPRVPASHPCGPAPRPGALSSLHACAARCIAGGVRAAVWIELSMPPPQLAQARRFMHPGRSGATLPRRPRCCHPSHVEHTPLSGGCGSMQAAQPSVPDRVAGPAVRALRSRVSARFHHRSCAPCAPRILPLRAAATIEVRALSSAMRPTGSSSLRCSFSLLTPALAMATYDLLSH